MKRTIIGLLLLSGSIISSCKKDALITPNTLQSTVTTDTTFSIFRAAITRANDSTMLLRTDSFAVVVPTDSAFIAVGMNLNIINAMPVSTLDSMIKYFFIPGYVQPTSGNSSTLTSTLGLPVFCYTNGTTTFFNGDSAVLQTTANTNAKLFITKGVILPPVVTLAQYLASDTSLALFNEAMNFSGVINNLSSGWYTIFAPVNSAFINAGYPDIPTIDNTNISTLTNLVNYNIVNAPYFGYNLFGNIMTDDGSGIIVTNASGLIQLAGHSNNSLINVTNENILLAGNIILHKTNGVLLP